MLYADKPFSHVFCSTLLDRCLRAIQERHSINLVAMPGLGVTFFIRHLAYTSPDTFVLVNSFEMHEFTKTALYNQLARKLGLECAETGSIDLRIIGESLRDRGAGTRNVVVVFDRFDRLGPILDQAFYANLRFLREVSGGKLVYLFVSAVPLAELGSSGLQDLLRLTDEVLYLPCYMPSDMVEIMASCGMKNIEPAALELSGGHHALLQILLRCQNLENALADPMVELIIKDLYLGLTPRRRTGIGSVAAGRHAVVDEFLVNAGYVLHGGTGFRTFTPLLSSYVQRHERGHLPLLERRLLALLKRNAGRVVTKREIFETVWRGSGGIGSDWSLNALVYRLRRHPAFDTRRYSIESHKKQGYILQDHRRQG